MKCCFPTEDLSETIITFIISDKHFTVEVAALREADANEILS